MQGLMLLSALGEGARVIVGCAAMTKRPETGVTCCIQWLPGVEVDMSQSCDGANAQLQGARYHLEREMLYGDQALAEVFPAKRSKEVASSTFVSSVLKPSGNPAPLPWALGPQPFKQLKPSGKLELKKHTTTAEPTTTSTTTRSRRPR